jgi:hypothetical protein
MSIETETVRRDAIINSATEQVRSLLETHFRDIAKSAEVGFVGDENQTEPVCKVKLSVEWPTLSQAAKVSVKIGWSVQFRDESEEEVDPLQSKLGLPEISPKVREIAEDIRSASPAVQRAATHVVKALKESNSKKEGA